MPEMWETILTAFMMDSKVITHLRKRSVVITVESLTTYKRIVGLTTNSYANSAIHEDIRVNSVTTIAEVMAKTNLPM